MSEELVNMTTKEAITHIADYFGVKSMYALAKSLSGGDLLVQTIQIKHYMNGAKPTQKVADRFAEVYGINITDVHQRGKLA